MIPSKHNIKDLISGSSKQFKGKMRLLYQSHPSQKDKNNYFERSTVIGTGYTTIFVQISNCTGTGQCASGTCDRCNLCVSYNSYRVPITGEAIEALEESPTFSSEGGGGGSSNIDPSGYVIDPNLFDLSDPRAYLILQKAEIAATFWADLLDEQEQWAIANPEKYSVVLNYYLDNTSPEGKAFSNFAIKFLNDNSEVTLDQFKNWFMGHDSFEVNINNLNSNQLTVNNFSELEFVLNNLKFETNDLVESNELILIQNERWATKTIALNPPLVDLTIELVSSNIPTFTIDKGESKTFIPNIAIGNTWVQNSIVLINDNYTTYSAKIAISGYINVGIKLGDLEFGIKQRKLIEIFVDKKSGKIGAASVQNIKNK
jgi:hypothetical protein